MEIMFSNRQQYQPRPQNQQVSHPQSGSLSLEEIVKAMADNTLHFHQETRSGLKNLENQVSQLANTVGKLQAQNSNKIPSQPERNPKENTSAISLRSGKQLEVLEKSKSEVLEEEQETIVPGKNEQPSEVSDVVSSKTNHFSSSVPFPSRLTSKDKKKEMEKEVIDVFRKVEVNISLLEAIRQVSCYAKFLKDLCTNKRKLNGDEKPPEVELKPLLDHLKYAFLRENDTLPVLITSNLTPAQEQKLVQVLKEHKTALRWTVADIKGISASMCQHRILLEEGAKPMMEVVKKEVSKLLKVGVIYPISDSP
ncbi:uncharacterized protein LOC110722108 isoform X4 [Chenopodium quinoa]|uniref:uncharacterized protein LOC110722108 isoform X4 n=1 Tax=Chenopodium quinoa TaxID=63459 RepID=UPI000B785965|nr:uncharacterized protein LOC110722108 isoform X4 [Chenopodium quinoa]